MFRIWGTVSFFSHFSVARGEGLRSLDVFWCALGFRVQGLGFRVQGSGFRVL